MASPKVPSQPERPGSAARPALRAESVAADGSACPGCSERCRVILGEMLVAQVPTVHHGPGADPGRCAECGSRHRTPTDYTPRTAPRRACRREARWLTTTMSPHIRAVTQQRRHGGQDRLADLLVGPERERHRAASVGSCSTKSETLSRSVCCLSSRGPEGSGIGGRVLLCCVFLECCIESTIRSILCKALPSNTFENATPGQNSSIAN
jgi:hypothetical protein